MNVLKNFIVLEGIDGSGTTTLLTSLRKKYAKEGIALNSGFEPTDKEIGRLIRKVLSGDLPVQPETVALLFSADRREHLYDPKSGILKQLEKGHVLTDRYLFSSLAYQTLACGWDYVYALNGDFPLPEHLIFLDLPVEIAHSRISGRGEKREIYELTDTQHKVRESYLQVLEYYKDSGIKIHILDGRESPKKILLNAWKAIFS